MAVTKGLANTGVYSVDTLVAASRLSPEQRAERSFENGMGEGVTIDDFTDSPLVTRGSNAARKSIISQK